MSKSQKSRLHGCFIVLCPKRYFWKFTIFLPKFVVSFISWTF